MRTKHVGTRGHVCSSKGLKVFPDVNEGLFGVDRVPPWAVFPIEVVVMLLFPQSLQVHANDDSLVKHVHVKTYQERWKRMKHKEIRAQCAEWGTLIPESQVLSACSLP